MAGEARGALARFDERKSRVVEMRFFGGLSVEETAAALKVSPATVMGDWRLAKAWLKREMRGDRSHELGLDVLERDVVRGLIIVRLPDCCAPGRESGRQRSRRQSGSGTRTGLVAWAQ